MFGSRIVFGRISLKKYFLRIFPGYSIIDMSDNLDETTFVNINEIIKKNRSEFIIIINNYFEQLNIENAGLEWFANNCSAKNPLSSPLIGRILMTMSCIKFIRDNPEKKVIIFGATAAQQCSITNFLNNKHRGSLLYHVKRVIKIYTSWRQGKAYIEDIKKNFIAAGYDTDQKLDVGIITYVDGTNRKVNDPYFGSLLNDINKSNSEIKAAYLPYIYTPFKTRIDELRITERNLWLPLFSYLKDSDLTWISNKIHSVLLRPNYKFDIPFEAGFSPHYIIKEAILEDMSFQYINNLAIYRIGRRIGESKCIKRLVYPFENKSLEKCMLIGLGGLLETVAYQHSSITPRHFSFLMGKGEIEVTPLPDKIVTSGAITYDWLLNNGNFPAEKLSIGCSLRYKHDFSEAYSLFSAKSAKLFLALSSSYSELFDGVMFLKALRELNPSFILRIRTHPNFPLENLPVELLQWVRDNVQIRQESLLKENFEWSDVTLYISSTVALESLMFGVPVIHLDIDNLDSDPLLTNVPNKWTADSPEDCVMVVNEISNLSYDQKISLGKGAVSYINAYFTPQNENSYKLFLN